MRYMGLNELRDLYLRFFESKGHLRANSFSLIPQNDNSLLLINAGMTPLNPHRGLGKCGEDGAPRHIF